MAHTEIMVTSVSEGYTSTITAGRHMSYLDEPEKVAGFNFLKQKKTVTRMLS